jgi:spermidine synthase
VQPAMLAHPEPRDVLIVGGGEGATLREVLAHRSVRAATMIDIDRDLVELCRRHLVKWHRGAFADPRTRLVHRDGREFVEHDDGSYDVIIIDLVDMFDGGPAQALYTRQFHQLLRHRLRSGGIVVVQGFEFSFLDDAQHAALVRTLRTVLPEVHSYHAHIPSFLGSWGLSWRPIGLCQRNGQRKRLMRRSTIASEFLLACFKHCKQTRLALTYLGPVLEDGAPFVPPPEVRDIEPHQADFPAIPR